MFIRQKEMAQLDIPVQRVALLQRSLSDVQVALPGFAPQQATAYLCVYGEGKGLRVAVALHLSSSRRMIFYLNDEGSLNQRQTQGVLQQGIQFVEAMGFLLGDLDLQRLRLQDRAALWESLPLRRGDLGARPEAVPAPAPVAEPASPLAAAKPASPPAVTPSPPAAAVKPPPAETPPQGAAPSVPPQAETPPAPQRSQPPASPTAESPVAALRRRPPSVEEMEDRRKRFLENLGRLLASF